MKTISIAKRWMSAICMSFVICPLTFSSASAQENLKTVRGQVLDAATGRPLAGVIVAAYGEERYSAMTDEEGRYELKAPDHVRSVSMRVEGYNFLQCAIGDNVADARLYHEAFTEFYKRETRATLSAEADKFENTSEVSIDPLIAQQLGADMRSVSRGGMNGIGCTQLIQGINSLNANAQPLVVIDDVLFDMEYDRTMLHDGYFNNMLANLNVNDIERVEVLKNGTALYGAKGANGVIRIYTKRNKSMATKIDLTINGRFELMPHTPSMMSAEDYRLYATELLAPKTPTLDRMKFLNNDPTYFYYNQYHNNTNWKDEVYRNAFSQNYGINVQGGDNVASYNLSVGYSRANSTLRNNDFSRFNMRLNTDIEVIKNLMVRFDASYSDVDRKLRDDGAPTDLLTGVVTSPTFLALAKSPFLSPYAYDIQGHSSHYLAEADDYLEGLFQNRGRLPNPNAILEFGDGVNRNSQGNRLIIFSVKPSYQINKHLAVSTHFALTLVNTNENYYLPIQGVPTFTVDGLDSQTILQNIAQSQASRQTAIQSDTRLGWKNSYGANQIKLEGGFRFNSYNYNMTMQRGYNTGNDKTPNMSAQLQFKTTGGADDKTRELVWYGLADYNYAQRYYASAGLSAHASSRFGKDAPGFKLAGVVWGLFPSLQGAWVITNEPWMPRVKAIDYLRLNVGYDVSGNDNVDYTASRSYFVARRMLSSTASSLSIGNIGNTELKWETTRRLTAGLRANFLDNRVSLSFNVFKSWTSNLLSLQQLAWTSGLQQNWCNDGKLENGGFDVAASVKVLNLKDWRWEIGASVGHYSNKVKALPNGNSFTTPMYGATILTEVGQPVGLFYGWRTNGVYATAAEAKASNLCVLKENGDKEYFQAGDMRFVDVDGNGIIDNADRQIIGNPNPDIYGNLRTSLNWKNITLNAVFNYSLGNDVFNYQRSLLEGGSLFVNQTTAVNSRWTTEGQQTAVPRVSYRDPLGNARFSDRWIENGSYMRLSSLTISYYIPVRSTYLQGITVWGNGSNLFTISRYLGSDPDCTVAGSILAQGIDRGVVAAGRSFSLGVNINL